MGFSLTNYFYVLAMPRSRTLWLSFLLSDHESSCLHEGLTSTSDNVLADSGLKYTGSVDTNPLKQIDYNGKLAVIKRSPAEVKESFIKAFHVKGMKADEFESLVDEMMVKYLSALDDKDALVFDYEDLSDSVKVLGLVRYLKPESDITLERIEYLQGCIIKTANNDLTKQVAELGNSGVIVDRIFDVSECFSILTHEDIWDSISEDGADHSSLNVDVVNQFWLGIYARGELIGVVQFKPMFNKCYDSHIHILKAYRKDFAVESGKEILKWCKNNIGGSSLYANVPEFCGNVSRFLLSFGFNESGLLPNAWLKNGVRNDMNIFTREV